MERLVLVPDEKIEPLTLMLKATLPTVAAGVRAENLGGLIDLVAQSALRRAVQQTCVDELLVWARSASGLLVSWSSLRPENEVVGIATAVLDDGLVARVFASSRSEEESAPELSASTWTNLEDRRGRRIATMAASPLPLFETSVGVLALVIYEKDAPTETKELGNAADAAEAASLLRVLIEDRLLRSAIGLE